MFSATGILAVLISFILSAMALFNSVPAAGQPYEAEAPDSVLLNAAVVSDLHVNGWIPHGRNVNVMKLMKGVSKSKTPLDAIVIPGDLTEEGERVEYSVLSDVLLRSDKTARVIASLGNHDVRGNMLVDDYAESMRNYYEFCSVVGIKTDKPYWYEAVNGYYFIALGSEAEVKDNSFISDEQLKWLGETLDLALAGEKPAFIICHQPLANTNNVAGLWPDGGPLGEQSAAVEAIIRERTAKGLVLIYISGHLHENFSAHTFENPFDGFYCLNMPSAQYNDDGGEGIALEVYADRILMRSRNYISGEWLDSVYTVSLGDARQKQPQ